MGTFACPRRWDSIPGSCGTLSACYYIASRNILRCRQEEKWTKINLWNAFCKFKFEAFDKTKKNCILYLFDFYSKFNIDYVTTIAKRKN